MFKKTLIVCGILLSVSGVSSALFADDGSTAKSSWYIGFGLGSGDGEWSVNGSKVTLDDISKGGSSPITLSLEFGVGWNINQNFSLGFFGSALSRQFKENGTSYNTQMNNYLLLGTFFPFETGLSVRGGAGLGNFTADNAGGKTTYYGYAGLLGLGYDFKLGSTFNLGAHLDYTYQKYNSNADKVDHGQGITFDVTFYWF